MQFKTELKNIRTFLKLVGAISSLEKIAWVRFNDDLVRFTVTPDKGSQVWATLAVDLIFEDYHIKSAEPENTINLELPLVPFQRALRSALDSTAVSMRLTKREGVPVLTMIIHTTTKDGGGGGAGGGGGRGTGDSSDPIGDDGSGVIQQEPQEMALRQELEKVITHNVPVRVLPPDFMDTLIEPAVRDTEVNITMPPLMQVKAISDRFTRLANATSSASTLGGGAAGGLPPRLELSANMYGSLRLRVATDSLDVTSLWEGLPIPELNPAALKDPVEEQASTRFREAGPGNWATVRVDGRDWSRVLSVGRLDGRVIASFADEHALVLYVFVSRYDEPIDANSVVTYYISSLSL